MEFSCADGLRPITPKEAKPAEPSFLLWLFLACCPAPHPFGGGPTRSLLSFHWRSLICFALFHQAPQINSLHSISALRSLSLSSASLVDFLGRLSLSLAGCLRLPPPITPQRRAPCPSNSTNNAAAAGNETVCFVCCRLLFFAEQCGSCRP